MSAYLQQIENANQQMRSTRQKDDELEQSHAQSFVDNVRDKATHYENKWSEVAKGGPEEIAGVLGLKGAIGASKKALSLYRKFKTPQPREGGDDGSIEENDDADLDDLPGTGSEALDVADEGRAAVQDGTTPTAEATTTTTTEATTLAPEEAATLFPEGSAAAEGSGLLVVYFPDELCPLRDVL